MCRIITYIVLMCRIITGADLGFQVRGGALKKLRRAEGDAKICGVFRVKNHDFTPLFQLLYKQCCDM